MVLFHFSKFQLLVSRISKLCQLVELYMKLYVRWIYYIYKTACKSYTYVYNYVHVMCILIYIINHAKKVFHFVEHLGKNTLISYIEMPHLTLLLLILIHHGAFGWSQGCWSHKDYWLKGNKVKYEIL